jgi:hypothetical protein
LIERIIIIKRRQVIKRIQINFLITIVYKLIKKTVVSFLFSYNLNHLIVNNEIKNEKNYY